MQHTSESTKESKSFSHTKLGHMLLSLTFTNEPEASTFNFKAKIQK